MSRRQFLALIVPLILIIVGFVVMIVVERSGVVGPPWDEDFARQVRNTLAHEFVGGMDDEREAWGAFFAGLNAYLQYFDIYAEVVPPWQVAASREQSEGQYVGIGVRTPTAPAETVDGIEITGVKPGGPADEAGLKVGDTILAVDGAAISEISPKGDFAPVAERIRGRDGTKVVLTVRDPAGGNRDVTVVRAAVDTGSVLGARWVDETARIGYLRLSGFQKDTGRSFREKLEGMLKGGATALVLDLRENKGGLLPQAIEVADALIDRGTIVSVRARDEDLNETIRATETGTVTADLPVAVLINRLSASASEVLAGALQDHRRAILIGERSWGKFLVQTVQPLVMQQGTALFKRTTAIYETPLGHNYQRRRLPNRHDPLAGIAPDLYISIDDREEMRKLLDIFENELLAAWNPKRPPVHPEFIDRALEAAIAVLKGETYYPKLPE